MTARAHLDRLITAIIENLDESLESPRSRERFAAKMAAVNDERELWGLAEMCVYLDQKPQTISSRILAGTHPIRPLGRPRCGPIFDADEVREWAAKHLDQLGPNSPAHPRIGATAHA